MKKEVKQDTYIQLSAFMVNDLELKGNELIVYGLIYGFSQDGFSWFSGSQSYIASWLGGASRTTVDSCLRKLVSKGLLKKRDRVENGVKFCDYQAIIPKLDRVPKNWTGDVQKLDRGCTDSGQGGCTDSGHHIYKLDNNSNNNKDNIDNRQNNIAIDRSKKPKTKEQKHKHGEFMHVLLTDKELDKLKADYPNEYQTMIRDLDEYLELHPSKSYANHNLTMRRWKRKDEQEQKPKKAIEQPIPAAFDW